jgi:hypothetical protein
VRWRLRGRDMGGVSSSIGNSRAKGDIALLLHVYVMTLAKREHRLPGKGSKSSPSNPSVDGYETICARFTSFRPSRSTL